MAGANAGLRLVRLQSPPDAFTILGRFPALFERNVVGGYRVAEEFLVLDGSLELEGRECRRGDLTFIPACWQRGRMRSPRGCTVLAWFDGPAIFHPAAELDRSEAEGCVTVPALTGDRERTILDTPMAHWLRSDMIGTDLGGEGGEVIDLALTRWARVEPGTTIPFIAGPVLIRLPGPSAAAAP